jgi:hypothetical protein
VLISLLPERSPPLLSRELLEGCVDENTLKPKEAAACYAFIDYIKGLKMATQAGADELREASQGPPSVVYAGASDTLETWYEVYKSRQKDFELSQKQFAEFYRLSENLSRYIRRSSRFAQMEDITSLEGLEKLIRTLRGISTVRRIRDPRPVELMIEYIERIKDEEDARLFETYCNIIVSSVMSTLYPESQVSS